MTHGVHTWFSSLLSLNQVVCFRKTLLVCFLFDCVGVNASEWACGPTHVCVSSVRMHTLSLRVLQKNKSNKKVSWLHHIDHFTSSALLLLGMQVITMQTALERVLKHVFFYGEWFVWFTFQLASLLGPNLHYSTKTINHWWSDLLILRIMYNVNVSARD